MTIEEIKKKAKWELFLYQNIEEELHYYSDFCKSHKGVVLPLVSSKDRYAGLYTDSHHYTTAWHMKYHFPILSELLNIDINLNDFAVISNIIEDASTGKHYDMSYLMPFYDSEFDVICATYHKQGSEIITEYISERERYSDLVNVNYLHLQTVNEYEGIRYVETNYHRLFKYSHCCAKLENKNPIYNKSLLITGDSQMIPAIPVLAYYYKTLVYLDNRNGKCSNKGIWKDITFDDVLVNLFYPNSLDKYFILNFK